MASASPRITLSKATNKSGPAASTGGSGGFAGVTGQGELPKGMRFWVVSDGRPANPWD